MHLTFAHSKLRTMYFHSILCKKQKSYIPQYMCKPLVVKIWPYTACMAEIKTHFANFLPHGEKQSLGVDELLEILGLEILWTRQNEILDQGYNPITNSIKKCCSCSNYLSPLKPLTQQKKVLL